MVEYRINLIRDWAMPPSRRERLFLAMLLYLAVAGATMAWVVYRASHDIVATLLERERIAAQQRLVVEEYGIDGKLGAHVDAMGGRLTQCAETLAAIEAAAVRRPSLAPVLLRLTATLPDDVRMLFFELRPGGNGLVFDLAVPVGSADSGLFSDRMITQWQQDEMLGDRLRDPKSTLLQRRQLLGTRSLVLRFTCGLQGGKT